MTKRICLWSGPRNISTALMYSFAQRKDISIVDEPLYAHYLVHTDARYYHPGANDVITDQDNDGNNVINEIIFGEYETSAVFYKHMTHHLVDLDLMFLEDTINIILTRDPRDMLSSFVNQIENPVLADTGYKQQLQLKEYLQQHNLGVLVVDSKEILMDPKKKLSELCDFIGIPFDEAMLSWEAGARPEDGIWAEHWYHNVHKSTGFQPYKPKTDPFPERLNDLLEECEGYYRSLFSSNISE